MRILSKIFDHGFHGWHGFGSIGGIRVIRGCIIAACTFRARFLTTDFTDGTDLESSVVSVLSVVGQLLRAYSEQDF